MAYEYTGAAYTWTFTELTLVLVYGNIPIPDCTKGKVEPQYSLQGLIKKGSKTLQVHNFFHVVLFLGVNVSHQCMKSIFES